ncbi:MAG: hypothetical protein Q7T33_12440 [Dehalococcoidia bacterium]|nr:hypothetical protein [Dehalococcoidia bacterium]
MVRATAEFGPGQRVRVVQRGTLQIGNVTLKDNVFEGVEIAGRNADGSYRVRGIIKTPDTDVVTIPAEWIEPL